MNSERYRYLVEGETEKALLAVLKTHGMIVQGKIEVFNAVERCFAQSKLIRIPEGSTIILVFDTDTEDARILKYNVELFRSRKMHSRILCIPQVRNFEDEIRRACPSLKQLKDFSRSKSNDDFKRDFLRCRNLWNELKKWSFDISRIWMLRGSGAFMPFPNDSVFIKTGEQTAG